MMYGVFVLTMVYLAIFAIGCMGYLLLYLFPSVERFFERLFYG